MSLTWEKIPDTLSHFTVLQATESWAGPGNKAMVWSLQSRNTFGWKAITFSWTHQDQEMLLHVPGSQSIVIGHTQYLWGLAVLVMFQMYLPLRFGYHGGCWCDNPYGRWWYRCSKVCSEKCLGSWWRDWDPLQICTKRTTAKSTWQRKTNSPRSTEEKQKTEADCVTCSLCPRITHYAKKHPFYIPLWIHKSY